MKYLHRTLLIAAAAVPTAHAQEPAPHGTAFVHVNVVPMDSDRVLRDQSVVVDGNTIRTIGTHVDIPKDATVIDGHKTAYLMPGLADMHIHADTRNDLAVYLSQGVTTVLHMGGARAGFIDSTVPAANRGAIPAPHVYAAFLVDGSTDYNGFVIKTPAQARAIVDLAKTNGYDFMKVYVGLAPDVFDALAEQGRALGLPLVGHGVTAVRLERQLAEGQVLVAHAEEFFYTFFTARGAEETDDPPDESRIPEAIALAKKYGATVTADLATYKAIGSQIGHPEVLKSFVDGPESAYVSPNDLVAWRNSGYVGKSARLERKLDFLRKMVRRMANENVELVAGTDAPGVPGMRPGFSLHDDLDELLAAGLTPFQVLSTTTREPGTFIQRTKGGQPFGVVAPGYRADLILSSENPLTSLDTLRKPLGVMAAGRWRDAQTLASLGDAVCRSYRRGDDGSRACP